VRKNLSSAVARIGESNPIRLTDNRWKMKRAEGRGRDRGTRGIKERKTSGMGKERQERKRNVAIRRSSKWDESHCNYVRWLFNEI
jgi:hypothetical protein